VPTYHYYVKSEHPPYHSRYWMARSWDDILAETPCRKIFHYFNHIHGCHFGENNFSANFSTGKNEILMPYHWRYETFGSGYVIFAQSPCRNISINWMIYMLVTFVNIIVIGNFSTRKSTTCSKPLETWNNSHLERFSLRISCQTLETCDMGQKSMLEDFPLLISHTC
jgi:hypothetical protein